MLIQSLSTVSCRHLGVAIFANNVRKYLVLLDFDGFHNLFDNYAEKTKS